MSAWEQEKKEIAREIMIESYDAGFIETIFDTKDKMRREQGWTLVSGLWSPTYIAVRNTPSEVGLLYKMGKALGRTVKEEIPEDERDMFVGVHMAGIPVVIAMSMAHYASTEGKEQFRSGYTRFREKIRSVEDMERMLAIYSELGYGAHEIVQGRFEDGDSVVLIDDLISTSTSKLIAKMAVDYVLMKKNLQGAVKNVAVIYDRQQGGRESLAEKGIGLTAIVDIDKGWKHILEEGRLSEDQYTHIEGYVKDFQAYQGDSPLKKEALELARKVA